MTGRIKGTISLSVDIKCDPDGDWDCFWQDKYGSGGDLDFCLDMVGGYIEDDRDMDQIIHQLITEGYASGFWWSISYCGDDSTDEWGEYEKNEEEKINSYSEEEKTCFFYEDPD